MQFIENTKKKIGKWFFQKELKTNKRSKEVCNLDDAKSVGIMYDATTEEQIKQVKPFVDYFSNLKKDVKALGFVNSKELSYCHIPKLQYDFFYHVFLLGAWFTSKSLKLYQDCDDLTARTLMLSSFAYLPLMQIAYILDKFLIQ